MPLDVREMLHAAAHRGWTRRELARRLGIDQSQLYRIEHGQRTPSITFRERVKKAFPDCDPDQLFRVIEPPEEETRE